jgi:hypothetical protein
MFVEWKGTKELNKKLKNIIQNFPKERDKFLMQEGELVKARVVPKTPVDTGRLRGAWSRSEPVGGEIEVYNNVEYAPYVEDDHRIKPFGRDTGKVQPGVFMLRDALEESQEQFVKDAGRIIERLFK